MCVREWVKGAQKLQPHAASGAGSSHGPSASRTLDSKLAKVGGWVSGLAALVYTVSR